MDTYNQKMQQQENSTQQTAKGTLKQWSFEMHQLEPTFVIQMMVNSPFKPSG